MKESYLVTGVALYAGVDIEDGKIIKAPKTLQNFIGQTLDVLKVALIRSRLKVTIEKVEELTCE
jgi:hypothetical protein